MARAGRIADEVIAVVLADLAARTSHLTLLVGDPFAVVDPLVLEPAGAFTRIGAAWTLGSRLMRNDGLLAWTGVPAGTLVTHVAGFDAAFNGALTFGAPIEPTYFPTVGGLTIPHAELFVGFDA